MHTPKMLQILAATAFGLSFASRTMAQATMYGVGDLSGGATYSEVRDASSSGGVIYAVGNSSANTGSTGGDTAFVWTSTGSITAIPNLATNSTATNLVTASAISSDGAYIAVRSRDVTSGNGREAAVVTTSGLGVASLGSPGGFTTPSYALTVSSNGDVLYGVGMNGSGNFQTVRYQVSTSSATAIPLLNSGDVSSFPTARAASADGNLLLGTSGNSSVFGSGNQAFLYNHTSSSVSSVALLSGGTWNSGLALNPAGTLALVAGDSTAHANGEVYLYNGSTTTSLGSPNDSWSPLNLGGLTSDGSVVGIAFTDGSSNASYIHNANGWLSLDSIAAAGGADLTGWSSLNLNGLSSDGTLVWGSGLHDGNTEGFVMSFSSDYLSAVPEPSTYSALAGAAGLVMAVACRRRVARG